MPFINEQPSEADIVKYGLREQDAEFRQTGRKIEWTIDRERDIYLRDMGAYGKEMPLQQKFIFYWQGTRINISLETTHFLSRGKNEYKEETVKVWPTYKDTFYLPPHLEPKRTEIIMEFKNAYNAQAMIFGYAEVKITFEQFE